MRLEVLEGSFRQGYRYTRTMNKPLGARAQIINFPFKDLDEVLYNQQGIAIAVQNGVLSVGVDDKSRLAEGKELALLYLSAWWVCCARERAPRGGGSPLISQKIYRQQAANSPVRYDTSWW